MKNKVMRNIILVLVLIIVGCKSTKKTIEKEYVYKVDTLYTKVDRVIYEAINDTIIVENPCDSLGVLKDFNRTVKTNIGKVSISNNKGSIQAEINLDSIEQVYKEKYRNKVNVKEVVKEKEIIKYRTDIKVLLILLLSIAMNIVLLKN